MNGHLITFRPLATTSQGRAASKKFGLPPYIDGSCRREPDLESAAPSISALCRGGRFAPRLSVGDCVLYITVKSSFGTTEAAHHKVIALLEVIEKFPSHSDASVWYKKNGIALPSNCMVTGNKPIEYEKTSGRNERGWKSHSESARLIFWDGTYRKRSKEHGVFLACKSIWQALHRPPMLLDSDFIEILGRVPGTQTPPIFPALKIHELLQRAQQRSA